MLPTSQRREIRPDVGGAAPGLPACILFCHVVLCRHGAYVLFSPCCSGQPCLSVLPCCSWLPWHARGWPQPRTEPRGLRNQHARRGATLDRRVHGEAVPPAWATGQCSGGVAAKQPGRRDVRCADARKQRRAASRMRMHLRVCVWRTRRGCAWGSLFTSASVAAAGLAKANRRAAWSQRKHQRRGGSHGRTR